MKKDLTYGQQEDPQKASRALSVALQHSAVAADQRNICTLLQVSKTWRTVVQQSAASKTDIRLTTRVSGDSLGLVTSFAGWVVKHPGLISKLNLELYPTISQEVDGAAAENLVEAANKLVDFSIQLAAAAAASGTSAPLRVASYVGSATPTAELLAALPAATMTKLEITSALTDSSWSQCFRRLSNLQELRLDVWIIRTSEAADSYLRDMSSLRRLTELRLKHVPIGADMRLLPLSLQHLELSSIDKPSHSPTGNAVTGNTVLVDLQHLTALQHLRLDCAMGPSLGSTFSKGSSVPTNLVTLEIHGGWPEQGLVGIANLHQVTSVQLIYMRDTCAKQHLKSMRNLPQLKQLLLDINYLSMGMRSIDEDPPDDGLLQVAAVWHHLPLTCLQLEALSITSAALQQLVQHVAAATKLTKLVITIHHINTGPGAALQITICQHLRTLKQLESLELHIGGPQDFAEEDAQELSSLVALTKLQLYADAGPPVDATTLGVLASSLTNLEELFVDWLKQGDASHYVESGGLDSYAMHALAQLTSLRYLHLGILCRGDAEWGLQLLTSLSRLDVLGGFQQAGQEAQDVFQAVVPGCQMIIDVSSDGSE